jgi:tRNA A-37 threonylcarbamoyl transferase component Bud32
MPVDTVASFVEALHRGRLLDARQLDELMTRLLPRFPESRALARELVRCGWLTPFQVNQLFQGHGEELLLGSYVLLERLGGGGMGQVFKARNWKLGGVVALKVIRKDRLASEVAVRRFQREIRAAAQLNHPHIVRALDADAAGGTHFLVMEHVEGTDLSNLVRAHGPLLPEVACDLVRQAALALQHAHERGLVHRDIKPGNLLLAQAPGLRHAGLVKVLDMGLARLQAPPDGGETSEMLTREGHLLGSLDYLAPEQARDSHRVDIRADLYGLGCTLYFLLTAQPPFPGGSPVDKMLRHRNDDAPLEERRPGLPPAVVAVVRRLMAKRPEDRYQTPAEAAEALAAVLGADGEGAKSGAAEVAAALAAALAAGGDGAGSDTAQAVATRSVAPLPSQALTDTEEGWSSILTPDAAPAGPRADRRPLWISLAVGGAILVLSAALLAVLLSRLRPSPGRPTEQEGTAAGAPAREPASVDVIWLRRVAALPADEQVRAVADKLRALNPGFDGKLSWTIEKGAVVSLDFATDEVTDISPVRALTGLKRLDCAGSAAGKGKLADLGPLKGMSLNAVACGHTKVADLTPLNGMPLTEVRVGGTAVRDLSPLKRMRLTALSCDKTAVTNLSPLKDMPLTSLWCDFKPERDAAVLRTIKTLVTINGKSAGELLK